MIEFETRFYQAEGAMFLAQRRVALLADWPGVGKTAQALLAMKVARCQRVLILCPSIARLHWHRQCESVLDCAGSFFTLLGSQKKRPSQPGIICSYDLAIRSANRTWITAEQWDGIICDESHYLNSRSSQRARLVWQGLRYRYLWCLSGTPAKNHAGELYNLLRTSGQYQGTYWDYVDEFLATVETPYETKIVGTKPHKVEALKRLLDPITLRRSREDVNMELPSLTYEVRPVDPSPVDMTMWYSKIAIGLDTEEKVFDQIANELRTTEALINTIGSRLDDAAMALSGLQASTGVSRRFTGLQKVPAVTEIVKMELLEGHYQKIVLFAWHRDVIEFLRMSLREFNPMTLYGGQLLTKRDHHISKLQRDPRVRVLIAQIAAAGVTIDLTAATEVGFVEASYVPSDNAQAVMRVHRFPQKRPVRCRFFTTPNSVDDQVGRILRRKTQDLTKIFNTAEGHTVEGEPHDPFAE